MLSQSIFVTDLNKLQNFASILAKYVQKGDCLALYGDLGAGKTTFTSFLVKSLNINEKISSPTFTLVNEYYSNKMTIKHIDAYRLTQDDDIGIEEFLNDSLVIIEWPENVKKFLPKDHISIFFEHLNDKERRITIEVIDNFKKALIKELRDFVGFL